MTLLVLAAQRQRDVKKDVTTVISTSSLYIKGYTNQ
jgi:hypothetical protein